MNHSMKVFITVLLAILVFIYIALFIIKLVFYSNWSKKACPGAPNLITYLIASGILEVIWPVLFAILPCFSGEAFESVTKTYQVWKSENGSPWRKAGIKEETSHGDYQSKVYNQSLILFRF
ncbi:unnamed protein product [Rotaria sordida]|uniref:Uncharacterized protein n=1 Tax=Rotaria sordida TaxID=392033 RepID=A0A814NV22_9BILA|nr:unnamed protein product [Rotaria sordida]